MKKVAVIGLGRFGITVARELMKMGFDVLAIDQDEQMVNRVVDSVTHALILDSTNRDALLNAGLKTFQTAVVGIGENIEASILTTLLLKEMGVEKVIARAINNYHGIILEKIGADKIVYPEDEIGVKTARAIANPGLIDFMEFGSELSIADTTASENMVGKTLSELQLRNKFGINVIAVKRGEKINGAPGPDDTITEGDVLLVSGAPKNISQLKNA
ncbi:MAG: TrkA family potassium uptake protein [bacterium]